MKIKALSENTGLSIHTLRYYEKEGLLKNIQRDTSGNRIYNEGDIYWIEFLKKMKKTHMPIKELKVYADSFYSNNPNVDERIDILHRHKKRVEAEIEALKEANIYIDYKLDYYTHFKEQVEKQEKFG